MKLSDIIRIGGHVSTSGGIPLAVDRAASFSFNTFQIFSKNQMQWKARPLSQAESDEFKMKKEKAGMRETMVHASYLLNMATLDQDLGAKVLDAFREEIRRTDLLGIEYLTFHPGSGRDSDRREAIAKVAENLNNVITGTQKCTILLETSAGQGNTVGSTFNELADIIDRVDMKSKVGICFDTCHVWASGYDIKSPDGYMETMDQFRSILGFQRLLGFHLNDSKKDKGSKLDRHEQIGLGTLGLEGIGNVVRDRRFSNVPKILETPKGEDGYAEDLKQIEKVMELKA
ncbi:MAG TPA: deoxyribonuclease IV [Thermoplasmataceae archaeon]|nr:deoxyribonuclease IV [Thermoplasmataceae archaeon]